MDVIADVEFILGDFTDPIVLQRILNSLEKGLVDLVISDMAPNISGVKSLDQARWLNLAELAFDFAQQYLKQGGNVVIKCFEGEGAKQFRESVKSSFQKVHIRKPQASRDRSSEFFIVGLNKID